MLKPPEFLAAHLDALVFLIFLLVTGIFRLLASKAQQSQKRDKEGEGQPRTPSILEQSDTQESDQERIRRFLEALGQPTSSAPPPPVKPRPVVAYEPPPPQQPERARTVRPRNILNPLPPLTTVPPPLPRGKIQMPRQIGPEAPKSFTPVAPPPETYQVQETTATPTPPSLPLTTPAEAYAAVTKPVPAAAAAPASSNLIANLLRSPNALRQAVLLREILGPPRSLSPLEQG